MNSDQINIILKRTLGRRHFRGVFASDNIPALMGPYPHGLVVNTDKMGEKGRHWQAIWANSPTNVEFFDSFGDAPSGQIKKYLEGFSVTKNKKRVQANYEISCGPFVIYYLIKKCTGLSMKEIVNALSRKKFVDAHVKLFVQTLI